MSGGKKKPKRIWLGLGLLGVGLLYAISFSEAQTGRGAFVDFLAPEIQSPLDLEKWMSRHFRFETDQALFGREDYWQTPEEMWARKKGDCEDYALFAESVLTRNQYEAFLFSVFGENEAHTVAVFGKEGNWGVFDQGRLRFSKARSLEALSGEINPQWSYSGIMRQEGETGIILRKFKR